MTTFPKKLRLLANFYEKHPDFSKPLLDTVYCLGGREEFVKIARECGHAGKEFNGDYAHLQIRLAEDYHLSFFVGRDQVCERRVVGKRLVPAVPEHEEDIVEWNCRPILKGE